MRVAGDDFFCPCPDVSLKGKPRAKVKCIGLAEYNDRHKCSDGHA